MNADRNMVIGATATPLPGVSPAHAQAQSGTLAWLVGGVGAAVIGGAKYLSHISDPFVQAWCRSPLSDNAPFFTVQFGEPLLMGHCWGCYVGLLGATAAVIGGLRLMPPGKRRN